ncbi:MAG: hypothetical protein MGG11_15085 [Trichodesmium sp. MAG_R03]|nr:hypothetical protein [Trichodesmium sp. MAG_R03]
MPICWVLAKSLYIITSVSNLSSVPTGNFPKDTSFPASLFSPDILLGEVPRYFLFDETRYNSLIALGLPKGLKLAVTSTNGPEGEDFSSHQSIPNFFVILFPKFLANGSSKVTNWPKSLGLSPEIKLYFKSIV